jgi:AbrB family looped-hinge helix DNA binding protein
MTKLRGAAEIGEVLMKIRIDSRGRITIPKSVRDRYKLEPGTALKLKLHSTGLVLKPVSQDSMIVRKNGFWVYVGPVPADVNWDTQVDDEREQRIKEIWNSGTEFDNH